MKERLGLTEIRKHANRMTFAEVSVFFCSAGISSDTIYCVLIAGLWQPCNICNI